VVVDVLAIEQHLARARPCECRQKAEQGGFARAVGTVKQNCVFRLDAQLSAGKRYKVAKVL
jgi:hypothetical protein